MTKFSMAFIVHECECECECVRARVSVCYTVYTQRCTSKCPGSHTLFSIPFRACLRQRDFLVKCNKWRYRTHPQTYVQLSHCQTSEKFSIVNIGNGTGADRSIRADLTKTALRTYLHGALIIIYCVCGSGGGGEDCRTIKIISIQPKYEISLFASHIPFGMSSVQWFRSSWSPFAIYHAVMLNWN